MARVEHHPYREPEPEDLKTVLSLRKGLEHDNYKETLTWLTRAINSRESWGKVDLNLLRAVDEILEKQYGFFSQEFQAFDVCRQKYEKDCKRAPGAGFTYKKRTTEPSRP